MILILWTIILILAIILIIIGRTFDITMSDVCVPAGWIIIFILGAILMFNGVTFASGEIETTTNEYVLDDNNVSIINSSTTTTTETYTTVQEGSEPLVAGIDSIHLIGFLLLFLGIFGFITFWFDTKQERRKNEE